MRAPRGKAPSGFPFNGAKRFGAPRGKVRSGFPFSGAKKSPKEG